MTGRWKAMFVFLCVLILIAGGGIWRVWSEAETERALFQQAKQVLQAERDTFKAERDACKQEKQAIENELREERKEKAALGKELENLGKEFAASVLRCENFEIDLAAREAEIGALKVQMKAALEAYEQELFEQRKSYEEILARSITLRNPTYAELREFLDQDDTNRKEYISGKYVCVDFAVDLNNAAEEWGFRAGYVFVVFAYPKGGKWGHFLNCFETPDEGLVFIEPRTDGRKTLAVGEKYWGERIKEIIIIW